MAKEKKEIDERILLVLPIMLLQKTFFNFEPLGSLKYDLPLLLCDLKVDEVENLLIITGNTSRNNVPNKRLLVGTFLCAILGTLRSTFCVLDIIWNILPNNIWHIFLISDL